MELFLQLENKLQRMDQSGCGSAHEALNGSYCLFL